MAGIDDVISLTITKASVTPSKLSFGIGMVVAYVTGWAERVRTYSKLSSVLADFPAVSNVNHPVYDAASAYFGQNPRPKKFKVGRRALPFTEKYTLTALSGSTSTGTVSRITLEGVTCTYTAGAAETTSTVATAMAALLNAVGGAVATAAAVGAVITVTATIGKVLRFASGIDPSKWQIAATAVDPGIATDLAAIVAEDNDFHDIGLDSQSPAQITAAAAFLATVQKELWFDTVDTICATAATTDIGFTMKAALYANVIGFFSTANTRNYRCFRAMGNVAARKPGSYTLKFKTLIGDEGGDSLTDGAEAYALGKNLNLYEDLGAGPMVLNGVAASGEFEDVTRFLHWQTQEIKTAALVALAGPPKLPFTNGGIDAVGGAVRAALQEGVDVGGIADDPPFTVTVPDALDVPTADRVARNLPGVEFSFRLAGAIHTADVEGTVTV